MANPFVHCELATHDVAKAKAFYGKLFDWKFEDMPMPDGTYTTIGVGEGTGGGMMKHPMPNAPALWMPYVLVADVKVATYVECPQSTFERPASPRYSSGVDASSLEHEAAPSVNRSLNMQAFPNSAVERRDIRRKALPQRDLSTAILRLAALRKCAR